jgi:hypothetical protein
MPKSFISKHFKYVVYKVTFPNGKIYVGKDIGTGGHTIRYFGYWNNALVEQDFSKEQLMKWTLTREILFESSDKQLISIKEGEFIRALKSNDPAFGYNLTHRSKTANRTDK